MTIREALASAAFLSIHFLLSVRQSAESMALALISSSSTTLASTFLFLMDASGFGLAANAAASARQAAAAIKPVRRANVTVAAGRRGMNGRGVTPPPAAKNRYPR
jgi:hypothetical protein